nr:hypothetical protein CFP56_79090 [Quercus suber]
MLDLSSVDDLPDLCISLTSGSISCSIMPGGQGSSDFVSCEGENPIRCTSNTIGALKRGWMNPGSWLHRPRLNSSRRLLCLQHCLSSSRTVYQGPGSTKIMIFWTHRAEQMIIKHMPARECCHRDWQRTGHSVTWGRSFLRQNLYTNSGKVGWGAAGCEAVSRASRHSAEAVYRSRKSEQGTGVVDRG